jgi:hypothetical protein
LVSADRGDPLVSADRGDPLVSADRGDPLVSADRGEPLDVGAPKPMPVPLSLQPPAELVCARWSLAVCAGSAGSEVSVAPGMS